MRCYRNTLNIKAMTFDLDDTLYDNRPVIRRLEIQMVEWMHVHHPVSAQRSLVWWHELKRSLVTEQPDLYHDVTQWRFQHIKRGLMILGYREASATHAAQDAVDEMFYWRHQIEVPPETHRVLSQLTQTIPLIAITNGNVNPQKIGLGDYFQQTLSAGPDGFSKPHADLFLKAQQKLALPAAHILHIGDHLHTDVYGAKKNGYVACWYNDQFKDIRLAAKARLLPDIEIDQLSELLNFI